jgi:mono/diheme cytochrome c family protein
MHFKFKFLVAGIALLVALTACTQSEEGGAEKASAEAPATEASAPSSAAPAATEEAEPAAAEPASSETSDASESTETPAETTLVATEEEKPAAGAAPETSEPVASEPVAETEATDAAKPADEAPASAPPAEAAASAAAPYTVVDGKIDKDTFSGWQAYRTTGCGQCHGGAGQGGAAPSLVDRLKSIDQAQFNKSVLEGKNLMPPWKGNPKVVANIDKLYAYLKARSDGALGEGKPEVQ